MCQTGDVVTVAFQGATGLKRRPAIVVSTQSYNTVRPDVVLGVITSNTAQATSIFDHALSDWSAAGLTMPSAFRCYFGMAMPKDIRVIGHVSDRDLKAIQECVQRAIGKS